MFFYFYLISKVIDVMETHNSILIISIVIISFLSSFVVAQYSVTGNDDGSFHISGSSLITDANSANIDITGLATFTYGNQHPFVEDLDGDGVNEIIAWDQNTVRIYQGNTLSIVDAFNVGITTIPSPANNYRIRSIIYDIDGDGYKEIIARAGDGDATLFIIEYNGTHIYEQTHYEFFSSANDCIFQCIGTEECYGACTYRNTGVNAGFPISMRYTQFTSTNVTIGELAGEDYDAPSGISCPVHTSVPYFYVGDMDSDGVTELVSGTILSAGSKKIYYIIDVRNVSSSSIMLEDYDIREMFTHSTISVVGGVDCSTYRINTFATAPSVYDFDGALGDGLEIVVGSMSSENGYEIYLHDSDLNLDETFNDGLVEADGELVSNVIRMNAIPSYTQDFCVFSVDNTSEELTLLCGTHNAIYLMPNEQSFDIPFSDFNPNFEVSKTPRSYTRMAHGSQFIQTLEATQNMDELVTSYGVFDVDYDVLSGEDLDLVYSNPIGVESVILPSDTEGIGNNDLLILTTGNLYYVNDGFENTPAYIDSDFSEVDPCLDELVKLNTTVYVKIRADDVDEGDRVQARMILYYDTANEQDTGWLPIGTAPKDFSHVFEANQSIAGGIAYFMVRDPDKNNLTFMTDLCIDPTAEFGCQTYTFSVSPSGTAEYGDGSECSFGVNASDVVDPTTSCSTDDDCDSDEVCYDSQCIEVPPTCTTSFECPDNFICVSNECEPIPVPEESTLADSVGTFAYFSGVPILILVLVVIAFFSYEVAKTDRLPMNAKFPIIIIGSFFIIAVSTILGFLNVIWIVLMIILFIGVGAIFIGSKLKGGS